MFIKIQLFALQNNPTPVEMVKAVKEIETTYIKANGVVSTEEASLLDNYYTKTEINTIKDQQYTSTLLFAGDIWSGTKTMILSQSIYNFQFIVVMFYRGPDYTFQKMYIPGSIPTSAASRDVITTDYLFASIYMEDDITMIKEDSQNDVTYCEIRGYKKEGV